MSLPTLTGTILALSLKSKAPITNSNYHILVSQHLSNAFEALLRLTFGGASSAIAELRIDQLVQ